jgi:hypothetical protein
VEPPPPPTVVVVILSTTTSTVVVPQLPAPGGGGGGGAYPRRGLPQGPLLLLKSIVLKPSARKNPKSSQCMVVIGVARKERKNVKQPWKKIGTILGFCARLA